MIKLKHTLRNEETFTEIKTFDIVIINEWNNQNFFYVPYLFLNKFKVS